MKVISVKFKESGRAYYFDPKELEIKEGEFVIVETARGVECGEVVRSAHEIASGSFPREIKPVIRLADGVDVRRMRQNRADEKATFELCEKRIAAHKLQMKLVDAEYTLDRSKLVFYFTADNRVDFRELVKDLASVFRARIELRQIGVRDEAKMIGGLGICGRPFCCAQFMDEFLPVSIKMAKTQNLSLNPTKISGTCGRLMCCLKYEQDAYEDAIKRLPKNDSFVLTPDGTGNVSDVNVLKETVNVRLDDRTDGPRCYHNCEVCVLRNGKGSREGIAVPDKRPERYVEPLAEEELPTITLLSDFDPDAAAESEKKRVPAAEAAAVSPTAARRRKSCVNSTACCWSAISTTPLSTPRRPCKSAWICPPSLTRTAPPSSISWPTAASFPWPPAAPSPPLKRLWTAFP